MKRCMFFTREALDRGARIERREHRVSLKAARKIARDHLCKKGGRAYPKRSFDAFGGWRERADVWGRYRTPKGIRVTMYRGRYNHVRFYTDDGRQVGPEQGNVAPAVAYALVHGWRDDD